MSADEDILWKEVLLTVIRSGRPASEAVTAANGAVAGYRSARREEVSPGAAPATLTHAEYWTGGWA